jgi:hypothetical protein
VSWPHYSLLCRPVATPEQLAKSKAKSSGKKGIAQTIPPCSCGAPRVFEFQLLSSLLHVLEVDKHSIDSTTGNLTGLQAAFAQSGMNFGNIAVYTCSKACDISNAEYVVVQDSVDDSPTQRFSTTTASEDPIVIAEGTQFEDDEDDYDDEMETDDGIDEDELDDDAFEALTENDERF